MPRLTFSTGDPIRRPAWAYDPQMPQMLAALTDARPLVAKDETTALEALAPSITVDPETGFLILKVEIPHFRNQPQRLRAWLLRVAPTLPQETTNQLVRGFEHQQSLSLEWPRRTPFIGTSFESGHIRLTRVNRLKWGLEFHWNFSDLSLDELRTTLAHRLLGTSANPDEHQDRYSTGLTPAQKVAHLLHLTHDGAILIPRSDLKEPLPLFHDMQAQAKTQGRDLAAVIMDNYGPLTIRGVMGKAMDRFVSARTGLAPSMNEWAAYFGMDWHALNRFLNTSAPSTPPAIPLIHHMACGLEMDPAVLLYVMAINLAPHLNDAWRIFEGSVIYADSPQTLRLMTLIQERVSNGPLNRDVGFLVLMRHLKKYDSLRRHGTYPSYGGEFIRAFLHIDGAVPSREGLKALAQDLKIDLKDLYGYVIDHYHPPALRKALDELAADPQWSAFAPRSKKAFNFFIGHSGETSDWTRLSYYLAKPLAGALPATKKLGFKLWVLMKIKGHTPEQATNAMNMSDEFFRALLIDDNGGPLSARHINRLATYTGAPLPLLAQWHDETYGLHFHDLDDETGFKPKELSISQQVAHALGTLTMEAAAKVCSNWLTRATRDVSPMSTALFQLMARMPAPEAQVGDHYLAAFVGAYGHHLDPARFWTQAMPQLTNIFPTLAAPHPFIELDEKITLDSLGAVSVPRVIAEWRLGAQGQFLGPPQIIERLQLSSPYMASVYEARDVDFNYDKSVAMARATGLDPALLYLKFHPWILLAVPVKTSQGLEHPAFPNLKTPEERLARAQALTEILQQNSDGAALVKKTVAQWSQANGAEADHGIPPEIWRRIKSGTAVLRDDELIVLAENNNLALDKQKLLEGWRQGTLLFFLGQTPQGTVDWSFPEGWNQIQLASLDLFSLADHIAQTSGHSFSAFWREQESFNVKDRASMKQRLVKGLSDEQIVRFAAIAHRYGHPELTPKVLYWHFRGPFLSRFVTPSTPTIQTVENIPAKDLSPSEQRSLRNHRPPLLATRSKAAATLLLRRG